MFEFRFSDFFSPRRLLYWRRLLWKSQYFPIERQRALQWELLSGLLNHCFSNVPYYKTLLSSLGLKRSDFNCLEDISKLPILNKNKVLDQNESFKAKLFEKYRPSKRNTTGTTGTPLQVYWDLDTNVMELLCHWRHYSWFGYKLGMPFLDIRSYSQHLSGHFRWNWKCQSLEISSSHLNESNIKAYAKLFKRYRIRFWRGHPHAIDQLCRYLDNAKIYDVKPKYIVTVGEALLEYQRHFIESWTGVFIGDNYGLTEHNALICQCPEGGYHIATEYGLVEIIKEDGTPANFGEEGRIIATGLHNKAFPLIRYDTGDYAILSNQTCSCGRTLPLIEALTGRIDDHVMDVNGRWVSSLYRSFKFVKGIRCSQIVQKEFGAIDVYIVPAKDYNEHIKTLLLAGLHKELGERMNIQIYTVRELPFQSLKKFKFVINRLQQETSVSGENA